MDLLILILVFVAIAGTIIGAYLYLNRNMLAADDAVRARLGGQGPVLETRSILKDDRASQLPFLDRLMRGRGLTEAIRGQLERAGSSQKPGVFLLLVAGTVMFGLMLWSLIGGLFGFLGFAVSAMIPWGWLAIRQRQRLAAWEQQFPDSIDLMANAMRAGYSFQAATRFVGEEVGAPVGPEFARFYDEQRLGMDVRTALLSMQERIDSVNLKMLITAVLIQRETGGNLTELMDGLSTLMRERAAVQGQIETLTAEPKISARLLTALPLAMFFTLRALNPTFIAPLTDTTGGRLILLVAATGMVLGYMMLMKIADVDF